MTLPRNHETEIKLRYDGSARSARAMIEQRGYKMIEPRTLEADQLFDRSGELKNSDQLLRLRRAGKLSTITYKGPGERSRHKSREEIEFDVSDPEALTLVLHRLGYHPAFRYEKFRTKFSKRGPRGSSPSTKRPWESSLKSKARRTGSTKPRLISGIHLRTT